jgi:hypothetical protein
MQFLQTADVVDVRVRADDCLDREPMAADEIHNAADFISGIEYERFACGWIADDRAVALKHADGQRKMNEP